MDTEQSFIKPISINSPMKIFYIVLGVTLMAGVVTGYFLSTKAGSNSKLGGLVQEAPKTAGQDNRTFRDFAEGKVTKKPENPNTAYSEGTHLLVRDNAVPVALTSSVVDLSQYEGKLVKVYGETQKALKEGWLMDVGKVETK